MRTTYHAIPVVKLAPVPPQDLYNLLAQGMGPDLHWFPEGVPLSRLSAAMGAMANTSGGTILLGIAPRSGHIQGLSDAEMAADRLFQAALLVDPPLVLPVPRLQTLDQTRVLWVTIPAGLPHVYSVEGRYLWRDGSRNVPIPARRLRRLLLERGVVQFESQVPPEATLDDLDMARVESYLAALKFLGSETSRGETAAAIDVLFQRGCLRREDGELRPTYAALMLFGRHPQRWLPTATILAARFSGVAFGDHFVKHDITGTLPEQLHQAEVFVRDQLRSVVRLVGLTHQETLEYPFEAVRELLVNAVAHRDYNLQGDCIHLNIFADRLEVSSPGELPGPVNLDNLLKARFSRNAVVVQVLSDLGFVERLGYGLERVVILMRENGMQPPRFEEAVGTFRVTLFSEPPLDSPWPNLTPYHDVKLNPRQQKALNYLARHQRITNREYQRLCPDVHPETLRRDLADLVRREVVLKIGDKRATYYIFK